MALERFPKMEPIRFDEYLVESAKIPRDPAYREITAGLSQRVAELLRNPDSLAISCCFEGCCVSWCCIRLT